VVVVKFHAILATALDLNYSFTFRPLHTWRRALDINLTEDWVYARTSLDMEVKRKIPVLAGNRTPSSQ
jgi:hypothetical protein